VPTERHFGARSALFSFLIKVVNLELSKMANHTFTYGQREDEYSLESLTDKRIAEDMINVKSAVTKATAPHIVLAQLRLDRRVSTHRHVIQLLEHGCRINRELKATESMSLDDQMPLVLRALRFCRSSAFQEDERESPKSFAMTSYRVPKVVFSLVHGTMLDNWTLLARLRTIDATKLLPRKERKFMVTDVPRVVSITPAKGLKKKTAPKSSEERTSQGQKSPVTTIPARTSKPASPAVTRPKQFTPPGGASQTAPKTRSKSMGNPLTVSQKFRAAKLPTPVVMPGTVTMTPKPAKKDVRPKSNRKKKKKLSVLTAGAKVPESADSAAGGVENNSKKLDAHQPRAPKAVSVQTRAQQQWDAALLQAGLQPDPMPCATSTQVSSASSVPTLEVHQNTSVDVSGHSAQPVADSQVQQMPPAERIQRVEPNTSVYVEGVGFDVNDSWESTDDKVLDLSASFDSVLAISPSEKLPIQYVDRAAAIKRKLSNGSSASPSPIIERQISFVPGKNRSDGKTPASGKKKKVRRRTKRRKL